MATKKTASVTPERVRAWCASRQGMGGALAGSTAAEVLSKTGWVRSVGGSSPYLALRDRAGLSRATVDAAVAAVEVHELPSARGCTYVVPAGDYAVALRASQGRGDEAEVAQAKKFCGVTDEELAHLRAKVLDALEREALDPASIKEAVGDAVRNLGPDGKKRGLTTTLPLVLGTLQSHGEIRRVPVNGRVDQQRYRYVRWRPSPLEGPAPSDQAVAVELARRFFRWAAPATPAQFAWWSGLGVRAAREALADLKLVALADDDARLTFADDRDALLAYEAPAEPRYSFVSSLDNAVHLRREVGTVLDPADEGFEVHAGKSLVNVGSLADLPYHPILDRGRMIGLWDYDGVRKALAWRTFRKAPKGLAEEAKRVERYVTEELGDARSFSLDSPQGRVARIQSLVPGW